MALNFFIKTSPNPEKIYLDTCFLVYALSGNPPQNLSKHSPQEAVKCKQVVLAKTFLGRILNGSQEIKFSSMLIPEYWRSNLINAVVEKEKCSTEQARKRVAGQPKIYIKKHYTYVKKADEKLQAFFKRYKKKIKIKESSEAISKKALMVMGKYSLDSYDAIHIATMQQDSFTHFATGDNHIIDSCKEDFDVWTYPCGSVLNEIYYMCLGSSAYKILSNNQ